MYRLKTNKEATVGRGLTLVSKVSDADLFYTQEYARSVAIDVMHRHHDVDDVAVIDADTCNVVRLIRRNAIPVYETNNTMED